MEKEVTVRPRGLNSRGLHFWGMVFATLGIISRGVFQRHLLGMGTLSGSQLLETMNTNPDAMIYATAALLLLAVETCAVPVFVFLAMEGAQQTNHYLRYLGRVAVMALVSEIPYNLLVSGEVLDTSSRNPAFGVVLCLIMMYFYRRYEPVCPGNTALKAIVTAAAFLWSVMLRIEYGGCFVVLLGVMWLFRKKPLYRNLSTAVAAVVCSLMYPLFMAAPMGALVIHGYNGERGKVSRLRSYAAYPVLMLLVWLATEFVL